MGTKTGNNGFDVDGKTYTFDRVESGEEGSQPTPADKGDITVEHTPKDIGENTKRTIGQYLSSYTVAEKNQYPVDKESVEVRLKTEKGYPARPAQSQNSSTFTSFLDAENQVIDSDLKADRTQKIDDPATKIAFQKGKSESGTTNGNVVLPSVTKNNLPPSIKPYISSVLSNNRFSDAATMHQGVDVKKPDSDYNPTLKHPTLGEFSVHRLAQVGSALSLRASAELNAASRGNNPTGTASEAGALLPSFAQLGASRVELIELEALDVLRSLTQDEIPESDLTNISQGGSWGSLNNVHDQYSGINAIGMIGLSVALTGATLLMYEGLAFIIGMINGQPAAPAIDNDGIRALGRSSALPQASPNTFPPAFPPDVAALIGIRPTVNPFQSALNAGTNAFFGIEDNNNLLNTTLSALRSATETPQFNSIVARTIIRAGLTILDSFKTVGGNPISVAQDVLSIVETIRSSKIIGAMNVFAQLGDALLVDDASDNSVTKPGQAVKKSSIDRMADDVFASSAKKSRLNSSLKLAWANNRSPSSYLLPDSTSILNMLVPELGGPSNIYGLLEDKARIMYKRLGNNELENLGARIPYDGPGDVTVKKIEGAIEGDYMPFYFHDLRTNEIISFHAFLTSLSDDFSVNWEGTDAVGRVDQVRIYKNTNRKISMSWYIVSTSEEDFNDMWFKINKLVTMVYPQFTEGRVAQATESTFIQPFSQLQGASPLVRLRLGDIFRSNYSRFALARLFGADGNKMKINGQELNFKDSESVIKEMQEKVKDAMRNPNSGGHSWSVMNGELPIANSTGITIKLPKLPIPSGFGIGGAGGSIGASNSPPNVSPVFRPMSSDLKFFKFAVRGEDGNSVHVQPSILTEHEISEQFSVSSPQAKDIVSALTQRYDNDDNKSERMVGALYVCAKSNLIPSFKMLKEIRNQVASSGGVSEEALSELNSFMNPDSNALVRSFQETRGKGLAGTIDSLSFDFYDNVTWETLPGKRAPQFMKVSISFTPIHDIAPGLDHQGFNRAPVYPVGHLAHTNDNVKENSK